MLISQPLGASLSLRVPTGLKSVPFPVTLPSDAATPLGSLQLVVKILPAVVAIFPPEAPTVSTGMLGAPVKGALGLYAPFAQKKRIERDRVVPLAEFGEFPSICKRKLGRLPPLALLLLV